MEEKYRKIDLSVGDPEPSDVEVRAQYVARSAAFFTDIMNDKLEQMKSEQVRNMMSPEVGHMEDIYMKGAINAFAILQDWGDLMVAEMVEPEEEEEDGALDI